MPTLLYSVPLFTNAVTFEFVRAISSTPFVTVNGTGKNCPWSALEYDSVVISTNLVLGAGGSYTCPTEVILY
jgi:glutamine synthetase type III